MLSKISNFFLKEYQNFPLEVLSRAKYLLVMNTISLLFLIIGGTIRSSLSLTVGLVIFIFCLIISSSFIFIKFKKCNVAGIVTIVSLILAASGIVYVSEFEHYYELYRSSIYLITSIFIASLITYKKINFFIYGSLSIISLVFLFITRILPTSNDELFRHHISTFFILIFLVIGITVIAYNILSISDELVKVSKSESELNKKMLSQMKKHNEELEQKVAERTADLNDAVKELTKRNEIMTRELHMAQRVQQSIIPKDSNFPKRKELKFGSDYSSMESVGGDIYDIIAVDDNTFGFLIADVSGHGVPAALITSMAKVSFNANTTKKLDTAEICNKVNTDIYKLIGDLEYYLTAYYCILNITTGELKYTNCGHHPAILYRKKTKTIEKLDTTGFFIGSLEEVINYETKSVVLNDGDRLLLFTDGIIEARNDKDEFYEYERLLDYVNKNSDILASEFVDGLVKDVNEFCGNRMPDDDRAILYIEFLSQLKEDKSLNDSLLVETRQIPNKEEFSFKSLYKDAVNHLRHNNYDKALELLLELQKDYPDNIKILNNLGIALYKLNRLEEAHSILEKASKVDKNNEKIKQNLLIVDKKIKQEDSLG